MSRSIFGWSLPPGCGALPGENEVDELEAFEQYLKTNNRMTPEIQEYLDDESHFDIIQVAIDFGIQCGINESKGDQGEYMNWLEGEVRREMNEQGENIAAAVRAAMQRILITMQNRPVTK